ncbi:nucleotidyltransferase domain-containing protein [Lederbergia wuyishanensis]|uniref:Nucleotidyltransferase n=1 Tax=Lederbergia wuyishanensis TaxID=1347903 RepID=A0ABU0D2V9_9BACI|nr:nucleotidyltransferase domain-containing protein [Lederbergia wuyishanensis]MCJ8007114.1 nucleotidyltransferase domain-containing protein [Lederbergia wuyishanensis]MDQ0342741.1 putative nucleotidyltransferase [Lederbergia wuyishanensis]
MITKIKKLLDGTFNQPNLLGILLMGSVSANVHDHLSDVDLLVIFEHSKPKFFPPEAAWKWDVSYMSERT